MRATAWIRALGVFTVAAAACAGCSDDSSPGPTRPTDHPPPSRPTTATIIAAGDIAMCGTTGAEVTAALLDTLSGTIIPIGDLAYFQGSTQQFRDCYNPTWGRHRERTRAAPGNHEYEQPGAGPYYDYFGPASGPHGLGYYSFREGNWLLLSLNSNVPAGVGSAQHEWLINELRRNDSRCTLAYFHHPLFSSGPNGDNIHVKDLWQALYDADVDVVLNGHDHLYERFAPQDPSGRFDAARGIRQFTVGTGGATLSQVARVRPNSEMRSSSWGVMRLTLGPGHYEWEFLPAGGGGFRDSGAEQCH